MLNWSGLRSSAESVEAQLEAGKYWFFTYFSIVYLAFTGILAQRKMLWYDELYTWYICRFPSVGKILEGLKRGVDLNPPVPYLLTRWSQALFGDGHFGTRAPQMLGFLLMAACLLVFVSKRAGALAGFVAALVPMVTTAYLYAYDARPYGLVLGGSALALACWQSATEFRPRRLALVGLSLGMACALLSHYYAVMLLVPLVVGEAVRTRMLRKVDLPVWLAFAAGCLSTVISLPVLLAQLRLSVSTPGQVRNKLLFHPNLPAIPDFYVYLLEPALWILVVCLAAIAIAYGFGPVRVPGSSPDKGFRTHEMAAAFAFALIPVPMVLLSGVFFPRYGLQAIIGLSILFAALVPRSPAASLVRILLVLFLSGCFLTSFALSVFQPPNTLSAHPSAGAVPEKEAGDPDQVEPSLPLVISSGGTFLQVDHYASPALTSRLFYLTSARAALHYTHWQYYEAVYSVIKRWFPIRSHVEEYEAFIAAHPRFMVLGGYDEPHEWVIRKLIDDGAEVRLRRAYQDGILLVEVTIHSPAGSERSPVQ